ncbi:uncharacterized protein N7477_008977, partial [Penicillium maclennaniae]|uniref:uncharacterized protein n=1 Tax=Penicillium maclennaniae TaxID=1343394 RepID=UPI0025403D57
STYFLGFIISTEGSEAYESAFRGLKEKLTLASILVYYNLTAPTKIKTDRSRGRSLKASSEKIGLISSPIIKPYRKRNIIVNTLSQKDLSLGNGREQILLPRLCLEHSVYPKDRDDPTPTLISTSEYILTATSSSNIIT